MKKFVLITLAVVVSTIVLLGVVVVGSYMGSVSFPEANYEGSPADLAKHDAYVARGLR
jgi:hypothetical protein